MADWYGGKSLMMEDQDFQEEDVWGVVKEREESNQKVNNKPHNKIKKRPSSSSSSSTSSWMMYHDGARIIPRSNEGSRVPHQQQQQRSSAPMGIPSREINKGPNDDGSCYDDGHDDDDDDDGMMVPPHEYIARRLARSHITSSMCEGVGRTLKGRDLSKLRNAILTKTGFLE